MLTKLLLIATGGALGSVARFLLAAGANRAWPNFPSGTLAVNMVGCLCIGVAMPFFVGRAGRGVGGGGAEEWRLLLVVGFLGALTTFSTYAYETFAAGAEGHVGRALANVAVSTLGGLALVWVGYRACERVLSMGG